MDRRRLRTATAISWARRSIAMDCGRTGMRLRRTAWWWRGRRAGLVDLDPETVVESGRLGPGQMLVVDLREHKVYDDQALLELFDRGEVYAQLSEDSPLVGLPVAMSEAARLSALQRGFGYTREDVKMILQPMATEGKDAVWSMGDDTPLAFLARSPRPVYGFFRQRFSQVTNPAIDPLRRGLRGVLAHAAGPLAPPAGQECAASGHFAEVAVPFAGTGGGAAASRAPARGGFAAGGVVVRVSDDEDAGSRRWTTCVCRRLIWCAAGRGFCC